MAEVIDRDLGFKALRSTLRKLGKKRPHVTVGVHAEEGQEMVTIAATNEFGGGHVPERSFLRETFDSRTDEVLDDLADAVSEAVDGESLTAELEDVGQKWADEVIDTILAKDDPPNAPRTIAEKGFDDPLVHTGALQDAITYKVGE